MWVDSCTTKVIDNDLISHNRESLRANQHQIQIQPGEINLLREKTIAITWQFPVVYIVYIDKSQEVSDPPITAIAPTGGWGVPPKMEVNVSKASEQRDVSEIARQGQHLRWLLQ
jgi:hypothetical protein